MTDIFTKEKRSQIMRKVKSNRNKTTELRLIQYFKENRITGWRRNYKIFGKPDFVFPKQRIAIFLDGCFWHGHDCRNTNPKDNQEYWKNKIYKNQQRDLIVSEILAAKKWKVIRLWECELKNTLVITQKLRFSPISSVVAKRGVATDKKGFDQRV